MNKLFFSFLFLTSATFGQTKSNLIKSNIDTSKLIVRVCTGGDLPGQIKQNNICYKSYICAYTYNDSILDLYSVKSFVFAYKNSKSSEYKFLNGVGNYLTVAMKTALMEITKNCDCCYFLAKVEVYDEKTNVTKNVFGPFPIYCN